MISTEKLACIPTFDSSQKAGSENQVSSTITSEVRGFPLYITATMDDVTTTLLIAGTFAHDLRTLSVPFTAGSINSTWNMEQNGKVNINNTAKLRLVAQAEWRKKAAMD